LSARIYYIRLHRHSISNVPIQALNKLESLALDIFAYDLNILSGDWSQWLAHIMSYHMSMASPTHPQPISRPSSNPHSIIRRAIEEIIQAPAVCDISSPSQPVFLGIEERKKEKIEREQAMVADVLEIDLDEDGPLRAEYLPKLRGSYRTAHIVPQPGAANVPRDIHAWDGRNTREMDRTLPPPARWSPAGDEPIYRERNRVSGQYVAVQPPLLPGIAAYPPPYYQYMDLNYSHWSMGRAYVPVESQPAYQFNLPPIDVGNTATYNQHVYALNDTRHLSHDQENTRMQNHTRTYSQTRFGDNHMIANKVAPCLQRDAPWIPSQYPYHGPVFAPIHNVHCQPTWIRI